MAPGEPTHCRPAAHVPPWPLSDDPTASLQQYAALPVSGVAGFSSDFPPHLLGEVTLAALQRFLPRNEDSSSEGPAADAFASDEFRMYEFKVRRCPRGRSHDWTECPYAHPGEKARRRDPRRFNYSGAPCPDFRRGGGCRRGESCEHAHGVFETWLHPSRYRTQPCKDGAACPRRICFFAHSPEQLRVVLPPSPTSPCKGGAMMSSSPTSTLALAPMSPPSDGSSPPLSPVSIDEVMAAMAKIQLSKVRSGPPFSTRRGAEFLSSLGSAPLTPGRRAVAADGWEDAAAWGLRAKLFECRRREEKEEAAETLPDLGWVSELVKD
ncbi:zinc finger CCCH domain-containing protein 2-like [Canna indica]|uniref:Zinc finger CCCH domain-containing protein 2-like n=1 Tax=Canna indica TaxID=4628 RepID=A0AAQ3PZ07_9LILI|nr:zinc finger CCCH domain-containing protein 2-like [Canna indica]